MAVYRDIDLVVYTDLPEALRRLVGIGRTPMSAAWPTAPSTASYGALTLAALSLSMGSASIAGEERNGTMGLLLGNPKSRTHILVSKATSMVVLTAVGAVLLGRPDCSCPAY